MCLREDEDGDVVKGRVRDSDGDVSGLVVVVALDVMCFFRWWVDARFTSFAQQRTMMLMFSLFGYPFWRSCCLRRDEEAMTRTGTEKDLPLYIPFYMNSWIFFKWMKDEHGLFQVAFRFSSAWADRPACIP